MANITSNRHMNLATRQLSTSKTEQEYYMGNKTNRKRTSCLTIFHQNIRSVMTKKEELDIIMQDKSVNPHLICLSEHHLKTYEISKFTLNTYKIAASYCRERVPKGGV